MNVRSREWVVAKVLGMACVWAGAWIAASLIMRTSEGHFYHPLTFISIVAVAAALCVFGMGLMEGKR